MGQIVRRQERRGRRRDIRFGMERMPDPAQPQLAHLVVIVAGWARAYEPVRFSPVAIGRMAYLAAISQSFGFVLSIARWG